MAEAAEDAGEDAYVKFVTGINFAKTWYDQVTNNTSRYKTMIVEGSNADSGPSVQGFLRALQVEDLTKKTDFNQVSEVCISFRSFFLLTFFFLR